MKNYSDSFAALARVTAFDSLDVAGLHLQNIQVQFSYQVVVFQGPIYRVQEQGGKAKVEVAEHIQLHHSTSVNGRIVLLQIDVVTEAAFPKLIEAILRELNTCRGKILVHYDRLLNSALDQKRVAAQNVVRRPSVRWRCCLRPRLCAARISRST